MGFAECTDESEQCVAEAMLIALQLAMRAWARSAAENAREAPNTY